MSSRYLFLFAVVGALSALPAKADLTGSTYHFGTSTTGTVAITSSGPGTYTDPANATFCVGPPTACATGAGVSGSYSFANVNPSLSTITFTFFGSTAGASGSFSIDLSNFVLPDHDQITGVTFASGSMAGGSESVSWNGTDAIFTGSSASDFNAIGGVSAVFDVAMIPGATPEPGSLLMLGTGLLGLAGVLRRKLTF
ncbi:MAG TPA: PEP-CTERM sorting domain-containing protein [Bryocella sp.]|nr:PEP-CTERM sorting domain-containing protein [Bryocella sp.]